MIEVDNLSKIYGDVRRDDESGSAANFAVREVSFRVERGEILGFLGPNGAGKTTTMRILTCLMAPTGGTARIAGFDVLTHSMDVRRSIGYLPENAPLYLDMTVRDYLMHVAALRGVAKKKRPERLEAALDAGKIEDRAETIIAKLSKGLRQRVGIAQAVVHDPPVLILDEPSAGLDPRQRVETRQYIKALSRDHTVILSTHILPDVQEACSRVAIIHRGRLVAQDSLENLEGGAHSLELQLARPAPDAAGVLRALPGVKSVEATGEAFLIRNARDNRETIARVCVERGWGLLELQTVHRTLEDVFLEVTRDGF